MGRSRDEHTVKPAGKNTIHMTGDRGCGARQTMHCNEGEWGLAKLTGEDRRGNERPGQHNGRAGSRP